MKKEIVLFNLVALLATLSFAKAEVWVNLDPITIPGQSSAQTQAQAMSQQLQVQQVGRVKSEGMAVMSLDSEMLFSEGPTEGGYAELNHAQKQFLMSSSHQSTGDYEKCRESQIIQLKEALKGGFLHHSKLYNYLKDYSKTYGGDATLATAVQFDYRQESGRFVNYGTPRFEIEETEQGVSLFLSPILTAHSVGVDARGNPIVQPVCSMISKDEIVKMAIEKLDELKARKLKKQKFADTYRVKDVVKLVNDTISSPVRPENTLFPLTYISNSPAKDGNPNPDYFFEHATTGQTTAGALN